MSTDKIEIITPPNESATYETQEKWEVIALPDQEHPCRETIPQFSEYLKTFSERLKKEYEDIILDIQTNFEVINREIEIDIRLKSNVLKDQLKLLEISGKENIEKLASLRNQKFDFNEDQFDEFKLLCENIMERGKILIDEFYEVLKKLEGYRSDKFKEILKTFYEKMEKCTYKLPYEMQLLFEEQILHTNQIILTNLRNYKELHLDLMTGFVNHIKFLLYNIISYVEEWSDICKREIAESLQSYNLSDDEINRFLEKNIDTSTRELIQAFYKYREELKNHLITDQEEIEWFRETSFIIRGLENESSVLEVLYSTVATQLSTDIRVKILKEKLLTFANRRSEIIGSESVSFSHSIICMESGKIVSVDETSLKNLWTITLKEFLQYLHMKYIFLKDLNNLWTDHEKRIKDLKLAASTELDKLIEKNDILLQEKQEMPLNIVIDSLRMVKNEDLELKLILKYKDYITEESEVYLAALKEFIEKYGRKKPIPILQPVLAEKNGLLYAELTSVEKHIKELLGNKKKIIQTIKSKMETYIASELDYAKLWMEEATKKVEKKYETKLEFHNLRYERIEIEIYNVRLAEIRKHQERFDSHKAGVEKSLLEIQEQLEEYQKSLSENVDTFNAKIEELEEVCRNCKTSQEASLCEINMKNIIHNDTKRITENVRDYGEQIAQSFNRVLTSNYNFVQHIKLFHEGGNFHPKEASMYSKKLLQLESIVQKKSSTMKSELMSTQKELQKGFDVTAINCLSQADSMHQVLQFKEFSEAIIGKMQHELKREVYLMKFEKKKIDTINERVRQLTNTNNFSTVHAVIKYCKELINHCKEHKEYLEEAGTLPTIYDNINDFDVLQTKTVQNVKSSKKSKVNSSKSKVSKFETPRIEEYRLFEHLNPEKYDKFMSKISHAINGIFQDIQKAAQEFYEKQLKIDEVTVPQSLDQYMVETLQRFKYYYLQCLQTWAFHIQEFLNTTEELLPLMNNFCRNYLMFSTEQQHQIFSKKMCNFFKDIDCLKTEQIAEIKYIHDQLKPLHGYHGNENLLCDLNNKMVDALRNSRDNFNLRIAPFQSYLTECKEEYKTKMIEKNTSINDFKNEFYDKNFCEKLISKAKSLIKSINPENFDLNFPFYITSYEDEDSKINSEINSGNEAVFSDEKIEVDTLMKVVEDEANLYEKKMQDVEAMYNSKIDLMLENWNTDMQKVKKLYTVKYE